MIDLPELLLSYGIALKKTGNEYLCRCFAHDDHNPSMSVYINSTGKYVAHCHACGFHEDVIGCYKYLSGNDDHKAALDTLNLGELHTGKSYAVIYNDTTDNAPKPERTMIVPPAGTPPPRMNWIEKDGVKWGEPHEVFIYRQPGGEPWYYEARWTFGNKKECRCFTYGRRGSAPIKWECSHHAVPRPLYGLDQLAAKPSAQVIVAEGPRKAEAAQKLLPMVVCIGWSGGANGWRRSDWSPLAGRNVILWPDADDVGREAMANLAQHLIDLGCSVHILDTSYMPDKWDARDALDDGWTTGQTLEWAKARKGNPIKKSAEKKTQDDDPEPERDEVDPDGSIYDLPEMAEEPPPRSEPPTETYFTDEAGITWGHPADLFSELSAPPYNPATVPECLREWIDDTAGVKGVDPSMLLLSSLVAAAACLHDDIKIQPERNNPSWRESARLWGAIVGNSGIKKSPAIGAAISRIKKIQIDLSEKAIHLEYEYAAKEELFKKLTKEYIAALANNDKTAQKPSPPQYPEIPRLLFEDVTVEKLADSLKASRRGCIVLRDELSGFFGAMNQYKGGIGYDAAAWLEFYEGGPRYTDRINRGQIFTPNFGGCLLGGIQPSAIAKIVDALPEDGMLQRFIVINAKQGREGNEKPYNKAANDRYHDMLQQIFDTIPSDNPVLLSPEANDIRKEVTRHAFKLIGANLVSSGLCSHLSKYEGLFARLALTYHAIECASNRVHPQSEPVSGQTAAMVKSLMLDFLLPHAIAFYVNLTSKTTIGHAVRKVAELCLVSDSGEIGTREFARGWIGWRHYKPHETEQVLQILVDQGWLLPHPHARLSAKGMPTRYLINPSLASIHASRKADEIERRKIAVEAIAQCREDYRAHHS